MGARRSSVELANLFGRHLCRWREQSRCPVAQAKDEVGFGEAYLDGHWDSPDLAALLAAAHMNEPYYKGPYEKNPLSRLYGWWQHKRRANDKSGSKANIEYHYDLGTEFYKMWLDDTMAYSAGMFIKPNETL